MFVRRADGRTRLFNLSDSRRYRQGVRLRNDPSDTAHIVIACYKLRKFIVPINTPAAVEGLTP